MQAATSKAEPTPLLRVDDLAIVPVEVAGNGIGAPEAVRFTRAAPRAVHWERPQMSPCSAVFVAPEDADRLIRKACSAS